MPSIKPLSVEHRRRIDESCQQLCGTALGTETIDQAQCRDAVKAAYEFLSLTAPEIVFCASPSEAMTRLLQLSPHRGDRSLPAQSARSTLAGGATLDKLIGLIGGARPKLWPALGEEVDVSFNSAVFNALEPLASAPHRWQPISKRVERKTINLVHLSHAVNESLEKLVTREPDAWLLHTQGSSSLWGAIVDYATLESFLALDEIRSVPEEYVLGKALLQRCGWVFSFQRLCLVCERPKEIRQTVSPGKQKVVNTFVHWRDDSRNDHVFA